MHEQTLVEPLAPLPGDPELYFEESWRAGLADLDANLRIRLDSAARYLQDLGFDHLVTAGFGEIHPYWVVQRTVIESLSSPVGKMRETLTLRRWCSGIARFWCSVRIQVLGDNGTHFETEAFWINFNKETKSPARISKEFVERFGRATENFHLRWKPILDGVPAVQGAAETPWTLRSADIDQFHHVNNAAYWAAVEELLQGSDLLLGRYRATIEYLSPVQPTEQVTLRHTISADEFNLWYIVEGKAKAVVKVVRLP